MAVAAVLNEPREVIEAYVAKLGLAPIEDPSNGDTALRRNALRHEVLPAAGDAFPGCGGRAGALRGPGRGG